MIEWYKRNSLRKYFPLYLSILSGMLFWLGWPTLPTTILLFVAFIPLFEVERIISARTQKRKGWRFFLNLYVAMMIFNAGTTWWIWYASPGGAISAVFVNGFLMTWPWLLYRVTRKVVPQPIAYLAFMCYWVSFEYLHLNWDLSWPWLTMGNGLAMFPDLVQWYEYTGILGGSVWIIWVNVLLHGALNEGKLIGPNRRNSVLVKLGLLFAVPIIWSVIVKSGVDLNTGKKSEVVVVQPNIDPYNGKFIYNNFSSHIDLLIGMSESKITPRTDFVVWPETAIWRGGNDDVLEQVIWPGLTGKGNLSMRIDLRFVKILRFLQRNPQVTLMTGISTYEEFPNDSVAPSEAVENKSTGLWEVDYNSAAMFTLDTCVVYHKSQLVIGTEKIPYPFLFEWLIDALEIEGANNLGTQDERTVFRNKDSIRVAPVICYESVYGEFLGKYVKNDADYLFIMTNDGWWRDTEGHRQHNAYASLRAIEHRRDIARSANTGISCFINKKGEQRMTTKYWEPAVIRSSIIANDEQTFYARNGDYLGRLGYFLAIVLLFSGIIKRKTAKTR